MSETRVVISAVSEQAVREFERFRAQATGSLRDVAAVGGSVTGMLAKLGLGLSVAGFGMWIKGGIDAADAMDELREKTGLLMKDVGGMRLIFEREGFGDKELVASMSRLSTGIVTGNDALSALSIKARDATGAFRSTKDVMYDVADRFAGMDNGAQKAALAVKIFGKSWADLIPMLNGGSAGMREMSDMADRLGLTIDEKTGKAAGDFNDTLFLLQKGAGGVATQLAAELLPTLSSLTGSFLTSMTAGDKLARTAQIMAGPLKLLYTVGVGVVEVFSTVGKTIGAAGAQMVAILSGDFKMAAQIGREWQKDVSEGWASTAKAISDAWSTEGNAEVEAAAKALKAKEDILKNQKDREAAAKKSAQAYAGDVKAAEAFIATLKLEGAQIGLNESQKKMMAAQSAAAKAPTEELRNSILGEAAALEKAKAAWSAKDAAKKLADDALDKSNSSVNAINDQTSALLIKIKTYGMLPEAITAMQIAELEAAKQSLVLTDSGVADIQRRIDALRGLAAAQSAEGKLDAGSDVTKAKELLDIMVALDDATKSAAASMAASFGQVGSAIGGLTVALSGYSRAQAGIAAQLAVSKKDAGGDQTKIQQANATAAKMSAQVQVRSYGDMASAAKGFFKESSAGYRVMEGAEKAFRAAEMAMAIESMLTRSGLMATFTGLFVTSKATEMAATVATVPVTVAAEGVKQGVLATTAMAGAVAVPFPGNLVAVGIVAAMLAAIGLSSGSGGGAAATTYQDRQKAQGTGTVLGDDSAKSESLANSLEIIERNSSMELGYQNSMLQALRNIETALGGAAKGIFQTAGLTGGSAFGTTNTSTKSFFGSDKSTTITDTGVRFSGSLGELRSGGGTGIQYEDVTKNSDGGWFHGNSTSSNTNTKALSDAALKPFTLIFDNMGDLLVGAGVKLGADSIGLTSAINQIGIDFAVSTRELKGQDLVDALSAGISVAFDKVTTAVFPQIAEFQKVGEGMGETLVRLASNYASLDATLNSIGLTFGQVGIGSLSAREHLIMLAGGIDKLSEQASGFAENYLTEAERLAPVQKYVTESLAALGYLGDTALRTRDEFKAAVLGLQNGGALATEAGAATFAALMALQGAFAMTVPPIQDATSAINGMRESVGSLLGGVDDAYAVLQRVSNAEKERAGKAHELTMKRLQAQMDVSAALATEHKALSSLTSMTTAQMNMAGTEGSDRAAAQAQLRTALAIAKASGILPIAESMRGPLGVLAKDSSNLFATMQDYQRDFYRTQGDIAALGALSDKALSVEEKMLAALSDQKDLAQLAYDGEIARLDGILEKTQREIDILNGIDTTGLTIVQALEAVRLAILAAKANPIAASSASINDAYKSALGRAPDAAGLEFFQDKAAAGTSISDIVAAIKNSPEAKAQAMYQSLLGRAGDASGIAYWTKALSGGMSEQVARDIMMQSEEYKKGLPGFAVGTNQVPYDMAAMIHKDERIIPAADNRELMARLQNPVANNDALLAEMRLLRQQVERLESAARITAVATSETAGSTAQLAEQFDGVTEGGNAMRSDVVASVRVGVAA